MTDSLHAFLSRGFSARERCGGRSLDLSGVGGGSAEKEPGCLMAASDFAIALRRAGVQPDEEAALYARWLLEGTSDRYHVRADHVAKLLSDVSCDWVEGHDDQEPGRRLAAQQMAALWSLLRSAGALGARFTPGAAKTLAKNGESKILLWWRVGRREKR